MPVAISALGRDFGAANGIATVCGNTVVERSDIAAVLISACIDDPMSAITTVLGFDLPATAGQVSRARERLAIWVSPHSWIVQCPVSDEAAIHGKISQAFPDGTVHAAACADHLCWLELAGPDPLSLLCRGTFMSLDASGLPVGHGKRTLVADVNAVIVRLDPDRLMVGVERSRARFFRDWLLRMKDEI